KIEILNTKEEVVFCKDFIGTEQQLSENINIDFKAGYKIRLTGSEHHVRVKFYNEDQEPVPLNLTQNKSTVILNENGVAV
ncbi:putative mucin/carbohydrate-binding domain-containing protein, partial [Gordonibacter pamelaeae]